MKTPSNATFIVILFFTFNLTTFYGQSDFSEKDYYRWFDNTMGVGNIGLYDGVEYRETYRTIDKNHQFFVSSKFLSGNIIYDGQTYYDVEMKYDIFDDELIVKLPDHYGYFVIQLIKEKVESFSLYNLLFVNFSNEDSDTIAGDNSDFYEMSFQSDYLTLLKKHKKNKKSMVDKEFLYYTFKAKNEHFIYANNGQHRIKSKKDVIRLFPEQKKGISTFYNYNRKLLNTNIDQFMIRLAKHISSLINNTTAH